MLEDFLAQGDPDAEWEMPPDAWAPIAVNYTSGTTARPKGVVFSHRGAYVATLSSLVSWDVPKRPSFLWTVPLFHCNGWCMPWLLALQGGRSVCLRRVEARTIIESILSERITHYCGAPVVHQLIREAAEEDAGYASSLLFRHSSAARPRPLPSSRAWTASASTSPTSTA